MLGPDYYRRKQRSQVFAALLLFNLVLVIIQLWLFVSILESALDGQATFAVQKAIVSAIVFAVNLWMLKGVQRMQRG